MSDRELAWRYSEELVNEPQEIALARQHSLEQGVDAVSPGTGAQLAVIAAASAAKSIVEIGTGLGVSGLWLFRGAPDATLTTIDSELDYQQNARKAFLDAGIVGARARLITGRALEVLPRMNDGSYDLVFIDADPASVIEYVEHGLRLARVGGTVLVAHALWRGRVADPAQRDGTIGLYRTLLKEISQSTAVVSSLSLAGDGLLQLTKLSV